MPSSPDKIGEIIPAIEEQSLDIDRLWRAVRKFSNRDIIEVVNALAKKGMTFRELAISTNLSDNNLNHILFDMKQLGLIIPKGEKKRQRKYNLTRYCVELLIAIIRLQSSLKDSNEKEV